MIADPVVEIPDMDPDPLHALKPAPRADPFPPPQELPVSYSYFDNVRDKLNQKTLRDCQTQAFAALANYYVGDGKRAACVMSVGAGKTALGVAACLGFSRTGGRW